MSVLKVSRMLLARLYGSRTVAPSLEDKAEVIPASCRCLMALRELICAFQEHPVVKKTRVLPSFCPLLLHSSAADVKWCCLNSCCQPEWT